jgi:hypothetical protein
MRLKPAADFEPVNLLQVFVGPDCPKLKDLVKKSVRPSGLGIIENKGHQKLPAIIAVLLSGFSIHT